MTDQVQMAASGEAAMALLTQPPPYVPTLLLLDVAMLGMGGIEFLEAYVLPIDVNGQNTGN